MNNATLVGISLSLAALTVDSVTAQAAQSGLPDALTNIQSTLSSIQESVQALTNSNATFVTGMRQASGGVGCFVVNGGTNSVTATVELRRAFGDLLQAATVTVPPNEFRAVNDVIAGVTYAFCKATVTSGDARTVRLSYCGDSACALNSDAP